MLLTESLGYIGIYVTFKGRYNTHFNFKLVNLRKYLNAIFSTLVSKMKKMIPPLQLKQAVIEATSPMS